MMKMNKRLFLGPHFADVPWSCSGLIALHPSEEAILVNVFAKKKLLWRLSKESKGSQELVRTSEIKYAKKNNLKHLMLPFHSAIARGRTSEEHYNVAPNEEEKELIREIAAAIEEIIVDNNVTEVYAPKAMRRQIDHMLLNEAVSIIHPKRNIRVFYYEDFPNFLPRNFDFTVETSLKEITVDISSVVEEKIRSVLMFKQTIRSFFKSKETLAELIRKRPYETYWTTKE